jgi:hypothetical protein
MLAHVVRFATMAVLAVSIVAPVAGAGRNSLAAPERATLTRHQPGPIATCHQYCGTVVPMSGSRASAGRSLVRTELVSSSDGFDWADAALGFGLAVSCGAVGLIVLSVFTGRRTRVRHAGSAS